MAHYEDIIYDNDRIKCKLCSVYITNDDYLIETHVKHETHRDLEVKRTLIRNSVVIVENKFYCYICEKRMDEYELIKHFNHSLHEDGMEKVKNMVEMDGIFLQIPEEITNYGVSINCLICDRLIDYNIGSVRSHICSDKHRRARAIAVQPLNGIFSVEGNNDYLWCKFCAVYFENYIEVIFEHVDHDKDHKTEITKILNLIKDQNISIEKFLMDPTEEKAHCNKCGTNVSCTVFNLERYVKGKKHNK